MRGSRPVPKADIDKVRALADKGLTASQIGAHLRRNDETIRRIARHAGIALKVPATSTKTDLTQEEADRIQLRERAIHLSGPKQGRCPRCGTWRLLDGRRVKPHPHDGRECAGSNLRPVTYPEES